MNMVITATPEVLDNYTPAPVKVPENKELYEKLGFVTEPKATTKDLLTGLGIMPLNSIEAIEWMNFLPTRYRWYSSDVSNATGFLNIDPAYSGFYRNRVRYKYDMPPIEVIKLIEYCNENKLFDELYIRTPEVTGIETRKKEIEWMKDPALFGVLGDEIYLLAAWAESKLLPRWLRRIAANINAWGTIRYDGLNYALYIISLGILPIIHFLGLRVFKVTAGDEWLGDSEN